MARKVLLMIQCPLEDGLVAPQEHPGGKIILHRSQLALNQKGTKYWHEGDCHDDRRPDGDGLCPGERCKEFSFLSGKPEYREEHADGG